MQGVPKLMAPSIACNNKKTKSHWFKFSLLMNSPHFSTQALKRSGIPHIALSSISAEKQHQTDREFSMRAAFNIAGPSCRRCSGRSPRGFRWATGLGYCQIIYPSPKSPRSCPGTTAWSWRRCELWLRPVEKFPRHVWPNFYRCAVRGMFSV